MSQAEGFLKLTASVVSTVDSTGSDVTHPEAWPTTSANGRSSVERQEFPPEQHLSELQAAGTRRHRTLWTRTNRWRNIGPEQHEHFMQHIQCSPGGLCNRWDVLCHRFLLAVLDFLQGWFCTNNAANACC